MALTTSELQANLIAQQQAEAANIVALIESVVDGRMNIHDVDFNDLEAKVTALNALLDGDENNEGFQTFQALVARMTAVETTNAAQATAIASLQSLVSTEVSALNTRIDTVESASQAADAALDTRVTTLETNATTATATRLAKDNEHDAALATQSGRIDALETNQGNTEDALAAEATARVAGDAANADAINVEKGRIDALSGQAGNFVTRDELSGDMQSAGQSFIDTLWAGRSRPAGLANTDGTVSV